MKKIGAYLQAVRREMVHVSWPSRAEAVTYTLLVVALSAFVAVYTGVLDFGFLQILNKITF